MSNDVVTSQIEEMSCDIVDQVVTAIKESPVCNEMNQLM